MNPTSSTRPARLLRRVRNALAGLFGIALAASSPMGHAQQAGGIPQPWISYARLASGQFQQWLSDGSSDVVQRLHAHLQDRMLKADPNAPPPPLVVRVWVGNDGRVSRVDFNSLGIQQADDDLRAILTGQPLSESPPRDMRQPMILQLTLDYPS